MSERIWGESCPQVKERKRYLPIKGNAEARGTYGEEGTNKNYCSNPDRQDLLQAQAAER